MIESSHHTSRHPALRSRSEKLLTRFLILTGAILIIFALWLTIGHTGSFREITDFAIAELRDLLNPPKETTTPSALVLMHDGPSAGFYFPIFFMTILVIAGAIIAARIRNLTLQAISLVVWIILTLWMILKFMMTGESFLFYSFFSITTLIYLCFFLSNLNDNFKKSRRSKKISEFILIFINSGFYFLAIFIVLWYCGYKFLYLPFAVLLAALNVLALYLTSLRPLQNNRIPHILFTILVCSVIPPAIFMFNYVLLFLASLSLLLLLYSKYTENQPSILVSYIILAAAILAYLTKWIFELAPAMFVNPLPMDIKTFFHGLVGSLFILGTVIGFQTLSKRLKIVLPNTIFSLSLYRRTLKGVFLFLLYLTGWFVYFFLLSNLIPDREIRLQTSFSFNCIYFIIALLYLSGKKSSFLPGALITASVLNVLFLTGIFIVDRMTRNPHLFITSYFMEGVVFHYLMVFLFMLCSFVILNTVNNAYRQKKNVLNAAILYFAATIVFILITEVDHIMVIRGQEFRIAATDTLHRMHRVPYSVIFLVSSLLLLVTGFIRNSRFLRIFSFILLFAVLLKILFYDLSEMESTAKSIWLLVLGISFIAVAVVYLRLRRGRK
jgi:hypothetical protein